jgi:hypothetical protein
VLVVGQWCGSHGLADHCKGSEFAMASEGGDPWGGRIREPEGGGLCVLLAGETRKEMEDGSEVRDGVGTRTTRVVGVAGSGEPEGRMREQLVMVVGLVVVGIMKGKGVSADNGGCGFVGDGEQGRGCRPEQQEPARGLSSTENRRRRNGYAVAAEEI